MQNENNPLDTPIGLYRDPASGKFIGANHDAQAAAMIQQGYKLFKAGIDAANTPQSELDALEKQYGQQSAAPVAAAPVQTPQVEAPAETVSETDEPSKKGK